MHHQVPVQIADCRADLEKQSDLGAYIESGSVEIDRFAFDIFHHQIWLSIFPVTGIQKPSNVGMRKRRQDLPLHQKALAQMEVIRSEPNQLHSHAQRDLTINAVSG